MGFSFRWPGRVGVGLFLFGLATIFYPPLQALIGSVTTSVAITAAALR